MQDTHGEYCNLLLTLGTCNSPVGTVAHHPDVNRFPRLGQRLRETGTVTLMVHVTAGRPRSVRRTTYEDAIMSAVEQKPWRTSCDIA